jgi:hypothetical protein
VFGTDEELKADRLLQSTMMRVPSSLSSFLPQELTPKAGASSGSITSLPRE